MSKALKIMLLVDLPHQPPNQSEEFAALLDSPDWEDERDIHGTLKRLGHQPYWFGIFDNIDPLFDNLRDERPDLVFILCESFQDRRDLAANIVSLVELLGIPYTGSSSRAIQICMDKSLTKKILAFHDIWVPQFAVITNGKVTGSLDDFPFPAIVKPLNLAASEGIAQMSVVHNLEEAKERAAYLWSQFATPAIVEEFIEGREIYLGVIGKDRPQVLPPQELHFEKVPEDQPRFATYRAKWDDKYRKKWGIHSSNAKNISAAVDEQLNAVGKTIFKVFGLRGYARIDLRLRADGRIYFIEANPNPAISRSGELAKAAKHAKITYSRLIKKIISATL